MDKKNKSVWQTLLFMSPFLIMSLIDYAVPLMKEITLRTAVLFYIHGALNQLIALCIGLSMVLIQRFAKSGKGEENDKR